ncbi:hypothetical protein NDU88_000120 [Pleurodeles waltl]|uniref:Uncharacterized protein n=1 Tax=Pleurodeles waltl TaxID=8319 RepID=A0AAV7SW04_PLEWA|nr:hypothetical protein NDU88_000120 [Pleurodeles waltl]
MDLKLESLSENLSHIILLSMLEQLEAKLDDLQNTLEDVPSRVAGLMEQIWIAKSQHPLPNGGVSLEMVCPMSIRDCAVSQSPATPQLDRPGEASLCLQPAFAIRHAPKQDCTFSSPTDVQVHPDEPRLCLQPVLSDRHDPQQDQCMQPGLTDIHESQQDQCMQHGFPDVHKSQQDQCMQPGFPNVHVSQQDHCMQPGFPDINERHQDSTVSRYPQTDPSVRSLEGKLCLQPEFADEQTPQQDHSIQPAIPEEKEPDEHLKQEPSPLSANSWDQKQNFCLRPLFPAGDEPPQNHCKEPVLPNVKESDEQVQEELMCFDCQDPQGNQCLQPVSPDGKAPSEDLQSGLLSLDGFGSQQTQCLQLAFQDSQSQQHLCLKQEFPYAQDPNVDFELHSLHPNMQCPDQKYKVEPLHTATQDQELGPMRLEAQDSDQNKLEPRCTDTQSSDRNYILEALRVESQDQHQNCKLELLCPDERAPSVPPSCLELDTSTGDQDALTDSMERRNTKSHLLLFKGSSAQQSHLESMDGEERQKGSENHVRTLVSDVDVLMLSCRNADSACMVECYEPFKHIV